MPEALVALRFPILPSFIPFISGDPPCREDIGVPFLDGGEERSFPGRDRDSPPMNYYENTG